MTSQKEEEVEKWDKSETDTYVLLKDVYPAFLVKLSTSEEEKWKDGPKGEYYYELGLVNNSTDRTMTTSTILNNKVRGNAYDILEVKIVLVEREPVDSIQYKHIKTGKYFSVPSGFILQPPPDSSTWRTIYKKNTEMDITIQEENEGEYRVVDGLQGGYKIVDEYLPNNFRQEITKAKFETTDSGRRVRK